MRHVTQNLLASLTCFFGGEGGLLTEDHAAISTEARVERSNATGLYSQDESWQSAICDFERLAAWTGYLEVEQRRSNESFHAGVLRSM
jgi:hypothetical protein